MFVRCNLDVLHCRHVYDIDHRQLNSEYFTVCLEYVKYIIIFHAYCCGCIYDIFIGTECHVCTSNRSLSYCIKNQR